MKAIERPIVLSVVGLAALHASMGLANERSDAASPVQVSYIQPEKFTDVRDRYVATSGARDVYLNELRRHIERRAARYLRQGENLAVSITEVDMAGSFEAGRRHIGDKRILRDVYPPRIDLAFEWTDSGGALRKHGERKLRNLSFLTGTSLYRGDPLRYENVLVDAWLEREFGTPSS